MQLPACLPTCIPTCVHAYILILAYLYTYTRIYMHIYSLACGCLFKSLLPYVSSFGHLAKVFDGHRGDCASRFVATLFSSKDPNLHAPPFKGAVLGLEDVISISAFRLSVSLLGPSVCTTGCRKSERWFDKMHNKRTSQPKP